MTEYEVQKARISLGWSHEMLQVASVLSERQGVLEIKLEIEN